MICPAPARRRAVIDIGTNSVKLLVADIAGDVVPVHETSDQTRLGSGFYASRRLQAGPLCATVRTVGRFVREARQLGAAQVRVIATSAARDAVNADELVSAIRQTTGLLLEVLSGAQEADWVWRGVGSDPRLAGRVLLLVDSGGGSTEIALGRGREVWFRQSFGLGTVRLLERCQPGDPPDDAGWRRCLESLDEVFTGEILPALGPHLGVLGGQKPWVIGTSGTATVLAKIEKGHDGYVREVLDGAELSGARLREWRARLWGMSLADRRRIPGMPPERADVMLSGVAIYEAVVDRLQLRGMQVSVRSLRYAALMEEGSPES